MPHHTTHNTTTRNTLRAATLAITAVLVAPASALNIELVFDSAGSSFAGFDPTNALVQALAPAVEEVWEDIFEDPDLNVGGVNIPLIINYRYANIGGLANGTATTTIGNRPLAGDINISVTPGSPWWFDPTPQSNSEFPMAQTLYSGLSAANQAAWYNGAPPSQMEVSYRGTATTGAPVGNFDLFSSLVHEVGHVLGLSHTNIALPEVQNDLGGDFDVNPDFVDGAIMGVLANGTNPANVNQWGHIAAQSLMCNSCAATGLRRLPTATDVFAIASAAGWQDIDLPRQDFIGGNSSFNTPEHWLGGSVPDSDDTAYVRAGKTANLKQSSVHVGELLISEAGSVIVGEDAPSTLTVSNNTSVTGGSTLSIKNDGTFDGNTVYVGEDTGVRGQDLLTVRGTFNAANLIIDYSGSLSKYGTVNVDTLLLNEGKVRAYDGTLTINAGVADLDGFDGDGIIEAGKVGQPGTLNINGSVQYFTGSMWAREASKIDFSQGWTLGDDAYAGRGKLYLDDGGDIEGSGTLTVKGDLIVNQPNGVNNDSGMWLHLSVENGGTLDVRSTSGLVLEEGATITHGATVTGGGTVYIGYFETLTAAADMQVDVKSTYGRFELNNGSDATEKVTVANYDQGFAGTLGIDLGGTRPSSGNLFERYLIGQPKGTHDQLVVGFDDDPFDGTVSFDGILDVDLVDGFTPVLGDEFHIVAYDEALWDGSEFDTYLYPTLTAAIPGWSIWLDQEYRTDGLWLVVDGGPFFGGFATLRSSAADSTVPEPASLALLMVGFLLVQPARRRRKQA